MRLSTALALAVALAIGATALLGCAQTPTHPAGYVPASMRPADTVPLNVSCHFRDADECDKEYDA